MHSNEARYQTLLKLQHNPENIRNISIIAHVDHGKTTLCDALISSNNIISKKLVGKLRYLDSRPDEQERQITMKSSSISLIFSNEESKEDYLINLIDSPGHVGFFSEVTSALRLTEGALILVDVLEGVSTQTYTVLKQAFEEKVRCILVLNKIDRLFVELDMSPMDVQKQLTIIIEQINAILSSFISEDLIKASESQENPIKEDQKAQSGDFKNGISLDDDFLDKIEDKTYFAPEKGNVIFCSAVHGWAFTISDFSKIFAQKLKCNEKMLQKFLWGEFYLNPKNKKVYAQAQNDKHKPMFVEFILQNIFNIYDKVRSGEVQKVEAIAKGLNVELPQKYKEILAKDPLNMVIFLMNKWLPIDRNILKTVIALIPNPREGQILRLQSICKKLFKANNEQNNELMALKRAIEECRTGVEDPTAVFISKMIAIPQENINEHGLNDYETKNKIRFIGFGRVFSGVLRRGQKIFVIGPKPQKTQHSPEKSVSLNKDNIQIQEVVLNNLYILMAQYLEGVKEVPAGNIVGIGNLDDIVYKTSTLSSLSICPSFTPIFLKSPAHLKVSLKTLSFEEYPKLIDGLRKLNKSDPSLEVYAQENGDVILVTCGETHLERCVRDLEDTLAKVKIVVSEPLVGFRETVIYRNLSEINNKIKKVGDKPNEVYAQNKKDDQDADDEEEAKLKKDYGENAEVINISEEKPEKDEMRFNEEHYRKKQEQKEAFLKTVTQLPKKIDKKNKAKTQTKMNKMNLVDLNKKSNVFETLTANKKFQLCVRTIGLKFEFAEFLEKNSNLMRKLFYHTENKGHHMTELKNFLNDLLAKMKELEFDPKLIDLIRTSLISFGPKRYGPNLLLIAGLDPEDCVFSALNDPKEVKEPNLKPEHDEPVEEEKHPNKTKTSSLSSGMKIGCSEKPVLLEQYLISAGNASEIRKALVAGFEMSVSAGPLCEEPMMGVCFLVESFKPVVEEEKKEGESEKDKEKEKNKEKEKDKEKNREKEQEKEKDSQKGKIIEEEKKEDVSKSENSEKTQEKLVNISETSKDLYGPLSGQIMSAMKEACCESFLGAMPRLAEGVYQCNLLTDSGFYGKSYEVLNKRRATILNETLNENSNIFNITAHLPIQESFGFYSEILDKTSGRVNAQLVFDTWKILEVDPFFCPQTEEEIGEFGEGMSNLPNLARQIIDKIRKRKGILTEEKIVVAAEKQRTLSKKK